MRRLMGVVVILLAAAFYHAATYPHAFPAVRDLVARIPHPVWVAGIAGLIGLLMLIMPASKPKFATIVCPGCGKSLQKGRRNCPFCKTELVKY